METYNTLAHFAQTWGLLYFVLLFAGIVTYALWPSNAKRFNEAAHTPLDED